MQIIKRNSDGNKVVYRPFRSAFDDLFMSPLDDFFSVTPTLSTRNISADMWEEGENVFVKMALPGMKEEDVKISIENDVLTVSASNKQEEKEEDKKTYLYRSMETSYEQRFNLPCKVNVDASEAKLDNGVITVRMPKSEEQKAKEIKVSK
ncbi:Hsp20/alpha crystallin family protein [Candidatus Dojkabacteria bacterium]|nr:Hsp20/alpha crystallin family protein [Candidatus Dojkabacteria bacterium]